MSTSAPVVVPLPPLAVLPLLLLLVTPLLRPPRRRVRFFYSQLFPFTTSDNNFANVLFALAEKEESDEDMGFGLFD